MRMVKIISLLLWLLFYRRELVARKSRKMLNWGKNTQWITEKMDCLVQTKNPTFHSSDATATFHQLTYYLKSSLSKGKKAKNKNKRGISKRDEQNLARRQNWFWGGLMLPKRWLVSFIWAKSVSPHLFFLPQGSSILRFSPQRAEK